MIPERMISATYAPELIPPLVVKILNVICKLYLTVIRGTPAMIQLLIMYYIVFGSVDVSKRLVAILTFGINSGAYVAEIIRSGIMSVDQGQDHIQNFTHQWRTVQLICRRPHHCDQHADDNAQNNSEKGNNISCQVIIVTK